jgi:hypothetical protein
MIFCLKAFLRKTNKGNFLFNFKSQGYVLFLSFCPAPVSDLAYRGLKVLTSSHFHRDLMIPDITLHREVLSNLNFTILE